MHHGLPTGTVTFLFTDVEGSTKLLHSLGADAYANALAEHRRVIREACGVEGGVEVDTQGDAFFFAFPTAPGALTAAAVLTESLAPGPIHVRVGLHTGTPLVTDEGYVGDDVHFAARVGASAHGGQVVLSEATRALVDGVALTELGEHRLKDIEGAVSLYQLGAKSFPPLKTISNTNLPRPASSFVGRERELSEVLATFERGTRLLTLTGPGGSGKTRLAVEAAATLVPSYKAGVFWMGLASLRDPALVTEQIAQTLGAKDSLVEHIAERELLLLLDNLEQVVDAAPELARLLEACPNLTVLCTSRELLRVQGEVEYPVPPLASQEAVFLFCERSGLEPTYEIEELCARLDHLPLAVELAAARTRALSPAQILGRLGSRLDLFKGGRDADPRQQTLRATIAWSHELLDEKEKRVFRALSVFRGGCTLEAAEAVARADLDTMQSLVEKSLLRFSNSRYWMLETIREFAAERLPRRVGERHLDYYLARGREFFESATTAGELDQVELERDNFRVALDSAFSARPDEAVELVGCLGSYWIERGQFFEGRTRAAAAVAAAANVPAPLRARVLRLSASLAAKQADFDEAERLGREALRIYRANQDALGAGKTLNTLGIVAWYRGNLDQATQLLEESLRDYDTVREDAAVGESHVARAKQIARSNLVAVSDAAGDHARAIELGREIVAGERGEDDFALIIALNGLGMALEETGQTEEARDCFQEAIALSRERGFKEGLAYVLASLAHLELARKPADALDHYHESLSLMHEMGEPRGVAYCLEGLGAVALSRGQALDAATLLGAASTIREDAGIPLDADEQAEVKNLSDDAARALGAQAFGESWERGSTLSVGRAVDLGLSLSDRP